VQLQLLNPVKQSVRPTDILIALSSAHHADKYNHFCPYSIVAQFRALEHDDINVMEITAHKGNVSRK